ncbi:hypothetical protein AB1L88_05005 [Tautonia sp. JC769]|uniref:hypothetical protein n=1 Tax=Tautonia sp. JC769 TaxID=3232135 RepID=UPI00345AD3D1
MRSEGLRFEILVNGERRCVVGSVGPGTLAADVLRWQSRTSEEPTEVADLIVHASRTADGRSVRWLQEELGPGDEVTIRVLGPGECDEPSHSEPLDD